jgi:amino acid transporter
MGEAIGDVLSFGVGVALSPIPMTDDGTRECASRRTGRRTDMSTESRIEPTGWVGWVWFAGIMLITIGLMDVFQGLIALFNDTFAVAVEAGVLVVDLTTWGWIHVILGVVLILTGIGVLGGNMWARVVGVIVVIINLLAQLAVIGIYPWWAVIVIILDVLVIYALVVHGGEAAAV